MTPRISRVSEMSEMSESDAIRTGESVRNVRCVLDTGRTDTPDTGHGQTVVRTDSQLAQATFDGTWVYWRDADCRIRIPSPDWLAWPSHTAAEMGPPLSTHAERAAQPKARR